MERRSRIAKLLAAGWIDRGDEIPLNAIPVDPDRPPKAGWGPPRYYEDKHFQCRDCGVEQTWTAEDQRWYYDVVGALYYKTAVRCRPCRAKHRESKLPPPPPPPKPKKGKKR
jgi:hypothetical protein